MIATTINKFKPTIKNFTPIIISLLLFFSAYNLDKINNQSVSMQTYTTKLEQAIHKNEREITKLFKDTTFIEKAITKTFLSTELKKLETLEGKAYSIFIYHQPDSLIFWSNNKVLPFDAEIEFSEKPISRYSNIKNAGYAILTHPYKKNNEQYALIGLIPVYNYFPIENEFLQNSFEIIKDIPKEVTLQFEPTPYEINNLENKTLFYLTNTNSFSDLTQEHISLILFLLGLILFYSKLNNIASKIAIEHSSLLATASLIIVVISIRYVMFLTNFSFKFDKIKLFDPTLFHNSHIHTLGDLLINAVIGFWLMLFFYKMMRIPSFFNVTERNVRLFVFINYLLIVLGTWLTTKTFEHLIITSDYSFSVESLYGLNFYSIIGAFALTIILLTLFLFVLKLKGIINTFELNIKVKITLQLIIFIIILLAYFLNIANKTTLFSIVFSIILINASRLFIIYRTNGFLWLVFWIFILGTYTSYLFYYFNNEKEYNNRVFYAKNLALERDIETEKTIEQITTQIKQDHFIRRISSLIIPRNRIVEQIDEAYLKPYFSNKYEYTIHLYAADSTGTKGEEVPYTTFSDYINAGQMTQSEHLYYWNNGKGQQRYIIDLPILADNRKYYKIVISLEPKTIEKLSNYPDLLLDKSFDLQKRFKEYNYAIYRNGIKIKDNNKIFPKKLSFKVKKENNTIINKNGISYLIHRTVDKRIIIVSKPIPSLASELSLFSFTFCLVLISISFFLSLNRFAEKYFDTNILNIKVASSLRNKIQNNIIAIIILTFIGIGVTTVFYFQSESSEYHAGRLERKATSVLESVYYEMEQNSDRPFYLPNILALATIHQLDVNLYDYDGEIIDASQPDIFIKNLISRRIEPIAFYNISYLKKDLIYREEKIGKLNYSSAYFPVKRNDTLVAFIGLPYYTEKENTRKDIGIFMGRLLNVYVLIFILAGVITYFLTKQITKPLDQLSQQMQKVKLGRKNEPLRWFSSDEIGVLIEQYNKMLVELERSANLLAQSEREGAWREMAKQVAHEIKNPLTPMKLQIQFLQRAYGSRPEDIGPLLKRTAYTLIEQIDGLTRIATDFSNFAKMPEAHNENLQLDKVVTSVYELFSNEEDVTLELFVDENSKFNVFADKDHIVRVLNNIIKNAIQSIPFATPYGREGRVNIYLKQENSLVIVKVEDNGCGIPDDKKEKVFVPNFTTKNSGTGLGLAMSKNIIESAGGKIYFETELNVGTAFYVELPLVD